MNDDFDSFQIRKYYITYFFNLLGTTDKKVVIVKLIVYYWPAVFQRILPD